MAGPACSFRRISDVQTEKKLPFHMKDLDDDAEEFIVSWAREFPSDEPMALVLHLENYPPEGSPQAMVTEAVHHYFAHRVELNQLEFRRLMQDGRRSLVIGLLFLGSCLFLSDLLVRVTGEAALGTPTLVASRETPTLMRPLHSCIIMHQNHTLQEAIIIIDSSNENQCGY